MPFKAPQERGSIRRNQILEELEVAGSGVSFEAQQSQATPLVQPVQVVPSRRGVGAMQALRARMAENRRMYEFGNVFSCEINETHVLYTAAPTPLRFANVQIAGENLYHGDPGGRTIFSPSRRYAGDYDFNVGIVLDQASVAGTILGYDLFLYRNDLPYRRICRYTLQDAGVTALDDAWLGGGVRVPLTQYDWCDIRIRIFSSANRTYAYNQSIYGYWDGGRERCRPGVVNSPDPIYNITI